jgi:hypothetical protein
MSDFNPFEFKPSLSETSRKLYLHNLSKLNGGKPITNLKFLGKVEDIISSLNEMKPNTRRTYLIAIVSALKDRPEAKTKKLYSKYYEHLEGLNKSLKDNTEKTEKVKENWVEQSTVVETFEKLKEVVAEVADKKKVTEDQYNRLLQTLILSLYTLQQPRRNKDYTNMLIVKQVPEGKEHNYLDLAKMEWVFNNYKTEKTYKQKVIPIPDEIKSILAVYFKFHPKAKELKAKKSTEPIPFLVHQDGTPLSSSTDMTRMLNKILGKRVGCSMLRAIYLTDKYGDATNELKKDTEAMGTSVDTALNNYIKKDD